MNLRLPYIPARDYQAFYKDQLGIEVDKKTCREVAKRARLIEQKVLGKPDVEFLKTVHRLPRPKPNIRTVSSGDQSRARTVDLSRDQGKNNSPETEGNRNKSS